MTIMSDRSSSPEKRKIVFSGFGEIYSYTTLQDAPTGYEGQTPYTIALIKLDEGPIITAQLTDTIDEPSIGDRVEMVTRKITTEGDTGMIVYGYKFRKLLSRYVAPKND